MKRVLELLERISCVCLGTTFTILAHYDAKHTHLDIGSGEQSGRIYLQASYMSRCTKTGKEGVWTGRKNYLSDHMTDDEIVKTAYITFKQAVEHEIMEGFKVDDIILFNPHVNFESLLAISNDEVGRDKHLKIVE